jgi:hypothetical protein
MAGIKTIIGLSFVRSAPAHANTAPPKRCIANCRICQVLAIGFLLVILSAALFHNYLTLLVVATYVIAPLPNWLCGRAASQDDFMESHGNGVVDFGRFLTGFFVVMGVGKSSPGAKTGCAGVWRHVRHEADSDAYAST